ncbi:MAG: putative STE family protein kinase [Streblomastix strix]|uniref:non-specific serine/threonine protein kinase n=1 Tax=Streblomastix strix TaxID=222440 RepID=A0A5J4VXM6_9EUKA|nr:MAG: putative STE family protein kinase [Streblomastix strix]
MSRVEDFKKLRKFPGGATGKTFLAEKLATKDICVLKSVDYLEEEDKKRADEAVAQMRRLDSRFTVHLIDTFVQNDELFMVLEYCPGRDLRNTIVELQKLPEKERIIVSCVGDCWIDDSDLKPANIFVMSDGSVRLDFGVSRNITGDEYGSVAGTKAYQGPEIYQLKKMDFGSDIFAVGLIVFQMLTGRHPYEGGSESATIERIKKGPAEKVPDWVSREMKELVEQMLDRIPSKRPSTRKIMDQETIRVYLKVYEDKERIIKEREKAKQEIIRLKDELAKANAKAAKIPIQDIPSSIRQISPIALINPPNIAHQVGNKIICTNSKTDESGVAFNPIISIGIVRFEGKFQDIGNEIFIGIIDADTFFNDDKWPNLNDHDFWKYTLSYQNDGDLAHKISNISSILPSFGDGQKVALEVNLSSSPRTLNFFVDDKQLPVQIINIPTAVRFWIDLDNKGSSFTITRFEILQSSSVKKIQGQKTLEWGKEWKQDEE